LNLIRVCTRLEDLTNKVRKFYLSKLIRINKTATKAALKVEGVSSKSNQSNTSVDEL